MRILSVRRPKKLKATPLRNEIKKKNTQKKIEDVFRHELVGRRHSYLVIGRLRIPPCLWHFRDRRRYMSHVVHHNASQRNVLQFDMTYELNYENHCFLSHANEFGHNFFAFIVVVSFRRLLLLFSFTFDFGLCSVHACNFSLMNYLRDSSFNIYEADDDVVQCRPKSSA